MKKHIIKDLFSQREADKYDNPIPSREYILDFLSLSSSPLTYDDLCEKLNIKDEHSYEAIRRRLRAMERDCQIKKNRSNAYVTLQQVKLVRGRVIGHPDGFGFVTLNTEESDLYLPKKQMKKVLDGDEVLVRISGKNQRSRKEAIIIEVLEHRTKSVVGRLFVESNIKFVRPDNPKISQDIIIPKGQENNAISGQVVIVNINKQPNEKNLPTGNIIKILGSHLAPGIEIDIAINNYGIPVDWPQKVLDEIESIGDKVLDRDKKYRVDLRHLPFVTIDGEDARDFDDAIYCELGPNSTKKLFVAVADVSYYVPVATALDQEACERGNSVYFPKYVVPMLPEELSNGLCSLKPNLDRLTLVCEMILDKTGAVSRYNFFEGLINSQARLTYNQVSKIISQRKKFTSGIRKQYNSVLKNIDALTDLYSDLSDSRDQRGSVEFESQESQIVFDAKKKIKEILPVERNQAHKLIEECMLCANVCAAKFLKKNKMPALYRVHPQPKDEKIENLKEFLGGLGIDFPGCGTDPKDYQRILGDMKKRLDGTIIQSLVLRSMNRAIYTPESDRHFGLNYPEYTHFTSPIRRYPDLLVHRAIRYLIRKKSKTPKTPLTDSLPISDLAEIYPYDKNQLISFGEQCSLTERRADDATRDVINWLKCEFLSSRIGEKFDGVISTVTGFGLFVQLDNMFVEGLIHVTSLPKDFYYFEEDRHRLVGEKTGKIFCLGDKLKVRVIKVELSKRKIDFELIKNYQ